MRRMIPFLVLLPAMVMWWRAETGRRQAQERVTQLEALAGRPPTTPEPPTSIAESAPAPVAAKETRIVRVPTGTDPVQYLQTIDELRDHLREQAKELSAARDSAARAEAGLEAEAAEARRLKAQLEEIREDMQAARRLSEALQAELKVKTDRLIRAETAEKVMQERVARTQSAAAKVAGESKEIEDLNRRREAFLATLMRRYREVGDLYRNFTLNAQTRETPTAGLQAGDLSRIQAAIQQAEDDLRQLQALNARAAQLARAK